MENQKSNKAWYKKWWVWAVIIIVLVVIGGAAGGGNSSQPTTNSEPKTSQEEVNSEPEKPEWDAQAAYNKIENGMTKKEVEKATGQPSEDCSETAIEGLGTSEYCTYSGGFGESGLIGVTYNDGKVNSKTKIDF